MRVVEFSRRCAVDIVPPVANRNALVEDGTVAGKILKCAKKLNIYNRNTILANLRTEEGELGPQGTYMIHL